METGLSRALSVIARPASPAKDVPPSNVPENERPAMGGGGIPRVHAHVSGSNGNQEGTPVMEAAWNMGQATPPAAAPSDQAQISLADAQVILAGLKETLRLVDSANDTGWTCAGVDQQAFYKARVLRDNLEKFVASAKADEMFALSKADLDSAEKVLSCSDQATARTPNTSAYIMVGVLVAGAALFLSMT